MEVVWNSSAADDFFERIVEPFERMTILFEQITRAVRTDDNFFPFGQTESFERIPNLWKRFSLPLVILCNTKFAEFVFGVRNASRLAMDL